MSAGFPFTAHFCVAEVGVGVHFCSMRFLTYRKSHSAVSTNVTMLHWWKPLNRIFGRRLCAHATTRVLGKAFDFAGDAFASLFAPELTPEQKREAEITAARKEGVQDVDFARYISEFAHKLERERESPLSKEHERDR
jgi:hypothetical protein